MGKGVSFVHMSWWENWQGPVRILTQEKFCLKMIFCRLRKFFFILMLILCLYRPLGWWLQPTVGVAELNKASFSIPFLTQFLIRYWSWLLTIFAHSISPRNFMLKRFYYYKIWQDMRKQKLFPPKLESRK